MPSSRLAVLFCLALVCAGLSTSSAVDVRSSHRDASVLMARAAPTNTTTTPPIAPKPAPKPAAHGRNASHNATQPVPKPKLVRSGRPAIEPERNPVYFNGRLQAPAMRCLNLTVREGGYCLVVNKLEVKRRANTTQLNSMILTSDYVTINTLKSWPDERIQLQGNIQVNGNVIFGLPPTSPPKDNIGKLIASVSKPLGTAFIEEMLVVSHHRSPSGRPDASDRSRHAITHDRRVHARDDSDEFDPISRDRDRYAPEPESDNQRRYMRQWKLVEHDDFEADLSALDEQEEEQEEVPDARNLYHGNTHTRSSRLRDAEDQDEQEDEDGHFDRDDSREEKQDDESRWERTRANAELEAQRSNLAGWYWNDGTSALQNRSHCGTNFMHARHPADSDSGSAAEDILTPATITVSKVFERLPEHSQLSLQAQVHFIDEWRGAVMFAMIDGEHVWLDSHESIQSEMKYFGGDERDKPTEQFDRDAFTHPNLCGGSHPWDRLAVPIRVVVPHRARSANITFGCSSLLPGSSFGIDDVSLLVR